MQSLKEAKKRETAAWEKVCGVAERLREAKRKFYIAELNLHTALDHLEAAQLERARKEKRP